MHVRGSCGKMVVPAYARWGGGKAKEKENEMERSKQTRRKGSGAHFVFYINMLIFSVEPLTFSNELGEE